MWYSVRVPPTRTIAFGGPFCKSDLSAYFLISQFTRPIQQQGSVQVLHQLLAPNTIGANMSSSSLGQSFAGLVITCAAKHSDSQQTQNKGQNPLRASSRKSRTCYRVSHHFSPFISYLMKPIGVLFHNRLQPLEVLESLYLLYQPAQALSKQKCSNL